MTNLRTDQYTHINQNCPVSVDIHPADDLVEIAFGDHRFSESTIRLVIDHPDTCIRITEALYEARNRLIEHLRVKTFPQSDMTFTS